MTATSQQFPGSISAISTPSFFKKIYNNFEIEFEIINGHVYANATAMCKAFNRELKHYFEDSNRKKYVELIHNKLYNSCVDISTYESISSIANICKGTIVLKKDFPNSSTWFHEKLVLKLAQYLDIEFEIWCDEQIATLLKEGKVELEQKKVVSEFEKLHPIEQQERVISLQERKIELANQIILVRRNNGLPAALQQYLIDDITNSIMFGSQFMLPPAKASLLGVVEIAKRIGLKPVSGSNAISLGKYVKRFVAPQKQDERLVNGEMREVNVYPNTKEVQKIIKDWYLLNESSI